MPFSTAGASTQPRPRRRVVTLLVLLIFAAAATSLLLLLRPSPVGEETTWRLVRVVDGDTVDLVPTSRLFAAPVRVRLLNINTPERRQRGYLQATNHLRQLLERQPIVLRFEEPAQSSSDRYDRKLAYVFAGETNVNVEMVRSGWSRFWTRYGDGRFPDAFRAAETEARAASRGLWSKDP